MGEEGEDHAGSSGRSWVVDPIDGTVNFLFGIPQWCVSIALEVDAGGPGSGHRGANASALATPVGVVYDAMRDECWSGRAGEGPTCNGEPVQATERTELAEAMVATGFGYDADIRRVQGELVAALLPRVRDIRRFGSAALDLAWTAGGRYDAYFERGVKRWDVAAGGLLCRCAGLEVHTLDPLPPSESGIFVAPAAFAEELLDAVSGR